MRCFISLELPEKAKESLAELVEKTRAIGLKATFTDPAQNHLTLVFLGEVADRKVEEKIKAFEKAASKAKLEELLLKGTGFFPNPRYPRVFWAGIKCAQLETMQQEIAKAVGSVEERPFAPHVTICRIKEGNEAKTLNELRALQSQTAESEFARFKSPCVCFKKSTLTPQGPVHEDLAVVKLAFA